jgi:hypothetical protein
MHRDMKLRVNKYCIIRENFNLKLVKNLCSSLLIVFEINIIACYEMLQLWK